MIRTLCGCKPSKKKTCEGSGLTPKYTGYQKVKR